MFEEAHEFVEEHSVEELADLMEVIFAIMKTKNILQNVVSGSSMKQNGVITVTIEGELP